MPKLQQMWHYCKCGIVVGTLPPESLSGDALPMHDF